MARKTRNFSYSYTDVQPDEKLISDGDLLIKQLAEKQSCTNITLQEQLLNQKDFQASNEFIPLTNYSCGSSTLSEFQEKSEHVNNVEKLKAAGLSNEDVQLFVDYEQGTSYLLKKHKNWKRELLSKRIEELQQLVQKYEEICSTTANTEKETLDRHRTEFALSIKPGSKETQLLKFAIENKRKINSSHLNNSIDNIKQIETELFGQLGALPATPPSHKIRRKARKLSNRLSNKSTILPIKLEHVKTISYSKESKWDLQICEDVAPKIKDSKVYTCKKQKYYTIQNGEVVKLNEEPATSNEEFECNQKLSVEEIKSIPKFQNYEPGTPSKTLYLKNLARGLGETDLEILFQEYNKAKDVQFKIMNGRMRGQAFVTFQNEEIAAKALADINGTIIKNKPIIIQFSAAK